jgi:hypothetical protein
MRPACRKLLAHATGGTSHDGAVKSDTWVVDHHRPLNLGSATSPLQFTEGEHSENGWHGTRYLSLREKPAFELSFWCGTCPFLFQRLEGANATLSMPELEERLNSGLDNVDDEILATASAMVPVGTYLPILLEVKPRLTLPGQKGDYFTEEQVATWGVDDFWGLPETPRVPYYRTDTRPIDDGQTLFEFIVPMVPPSWNNADKVEGHKTLLLSSSSPTCLSVATLDIRQQADWDTPEEGLVHWCLSHFVIDGHHKLQAAADSARRVRLLTLVSFDHSLASPENIDRLVTLLGVSRSTVGGDRVDD